MSPVFDPVFDPKNALTLRRKAHFFMSIDNLRSINALLRRLPNDKTSKGYWQYGNGRQGSGKHRPKQPGVFPVSPTPAIGFVIGSKV